MTSSDGNKKSTKRKRNVEIKKEEQSNNCDAFSNRKLGLFNKVTELSILCNAKTAMIITSPNAKLYACGYPNPDSVFKHFLGKENSLMETEKRKQDEGTIETLRLEHEAIQERLNEEKKILQGVIEKNKSSSCFPSWWVQSIDDMGLEYLEQFKSALENLKLNLVASLEEKKVQINFNSSSTSNII